MGDSAADFPVESLYELANLFSVDLTKLITGQTPRLHTYSITRHEKGPEVERRSPSSTGAWLTTFSTARPSPFWCRFRSSRNNGPWG
ncbi:MAG: hypothetical protein GX438_12060 [Treponema sp.]|nr:hypothetical protein [Treponema sp.]